MPDVNRNWFNDAAKTFTYIFTFILVIYLVLVGFNDLYIPFSYLVPFWTLYERIGIVLTGFVSLTQLIWLACYIKSVSNEKFINLAVVATIFWFIFMGCMIFLAHIH